MSFQTRLLLTYSILTIVLAVTFGVLFYQYGSRLFAANAYSNVTVVTEKMSQQLDNLVQKMDLITTYLVSMNDFMSSMTSLSTLERNGPQNLLFINEGRQLILGDILTYAVEKNFYRVSVFNDRGDFLTSNFRTESVGEEGQGRLVQSLPWRKRAIDAGGRAVILAPYQDEWAVSAGPEVFGLVRSVQGPRGVIGYIEVQTLYSELQKVFSIPPRDRIQVTAITAAGEVFYSSGPAVGPVVQRAANLADSAEGKAAIAMDLVAGRDQLAASAVSDYTGIRVVLAQDRNALFEPLWNTYRISLALGALILAASLGCIYVFARYLARPIQRLRREMENTELDNLSEKLSLVSSSNEIAALHRSFQRLRGRLNEAVSREIKSRTLQMQASFDSLQAQVNPHFIYNVLNIISHKGLMSGDDEIGEICDGIASMLRYSTSTLKRAATIAEELEHVATYMLLMQKRFEHLLEYQASVDPVLCEQPIPKLVLQQLAENSINHGFENRSSPMRIVIRGYLSDGWWYVEVTDNGQGFDPDVLLRLQEKMSQVRAEFSGAVSEAGFAIGGMGLVNTYARMMVFYGGRFAFRLENSGAEGARVTIGAAVAVKDDRTG